MTQRLARAVGGARGAPTTACGPDPAAPVKAHVEGDGILSASSAGGGTAAHAPGNGRFRSSFGSYVLCKERSAELLKIESVTFNMGNPEPLSASAFIRHVSPGDLSNASSPDALGPFISALGSPPDFSEPYAGYRPTGTFRKAAGTTVSEGCSSAREAAGAAANNYRFTSGFTNLVVSLEAGPEGAVVKDFTINYEVAGDHYRLLVENELIGCGTRVTTDNICP